MTCRHRISCRCLILTNKNVPLRKGWDIFEAKANSTQEIPLLLENATNKRWSENFKDKHGVDAKLYLYDMVNVKKEKETEYPA